MINNEKDIISIDGESTNEQQVTKIGTNYNLNG